ncbi:TIR domain-containing protein [Microbulbifer sp. SSSA007]|uniref:TIR domain-containing protein n=1 Tax=Microbulbifer sp. SSSA007 TaxID=3243379 RepID=UPI004039A7A2
MIKVEVEMSVSKELDLLLSELEESTDIKSAEVNALQEAANDIGKSWSGSWLGNQSSIYYKNFGVPPAWAVFSVADGLNQGLTAGDWQQYDGKDVITHIVDRVGELQLAEYNLKGKEAKKKFDVIKSSALSLIYSSFYSDRDSYLEKLMGEIESLKVHEKSDYIDSVKPKGKISSIDFVAIEQGLRVPPHISLIGECFSLEQPFVSCRELKSKLIKLSEHIKNLERKKGVENRVGTNVFIGHGRSLIWKDLKDFINERVDLPWDEFNRIPVAGIPNTIRLAQMLDQACIAFLVMTAEDEQADGNHHARMNVIHEVGLFQGRLGFTRAIVLLEEGCEQFSNIQGLGQLRFPKGNISAIFEDVRQVLEREGILD